MTDQGDTHDKGSVEYQLGLLDALVAPATTLPVSQNSKTNIALECAPAITAPAVPRFGDFGMYFDQRKRKLAEQAEQRAATAPRRDQIFAGVVFHINGYTQPSHYELKLLLVERGGRFLHYLSKKQVTHIIASGLTMSKEKEFRNYKIVHPEWVVDSVKAQKMLSWQRYSIFSNTYARFSARPPQAVDDADDWGDWSDISQANAVPDTSTSDSYSKPPPAPASAGHDTTSTRRQAPPLLAVSVVDRFDEGLNRSWVRKNLVTDKDFIARYYDNSRLHHMSAWKAEIKDYVAQLSRKRSVQPKKLSGGGANEGELGVAGNSGGTSQIASCNYLVRSFGMKSGMFMAQASQLCPSLVTIPYDFDAYKRMSKAFYDIVTEIADETQAVSIDEALLDVTHVVHQQYQGDAEALAQHIRRRVLEGTKCTVSVAIGPSIMLARIATIRAKPNGVRSLDIDQFLALDLAARDLPEIGHTVEETLESHLQAICGEKTAETLYEFSCGVDNRAPEPNKPRKAFGAEIGWGVRLSNQHEADDFVTRLAEEVCRSMEDAKRAGSAVALRIKKRQEGQGKPGKFLGHGICDSLSKSAMLPGMTYDRAKIAPVCLKLLHHMDVDPLDIRAVGIQVHKLAISESHADVGDMLAKSKVAQSEDTKQSSSVFSDLPSASQLDASVLSELPESILQELQAAYQQINPNIDLGLNSRNSTRFSPKLHALQARGSAVKQLCRTGSSRGSAFGRGRSHKLASPTVARPKVIPGKANLVDAFRKIESLDSILSSQMDSEVWGHLPLNIRRELAREYVRTSTSKPTVATIDPEASTVSTKAPTDVVLSAPILFGKHRVADIRKLIKAWVDSSALGPAKKM
ncbi:deoxycytidyl transferase [Coemansia sp. BCRC 34301]|nr:deoxycytidyl transferase [Coemansia sp. BCRC 34301]